MNKLGFKEKMIREAYERIKQNADIPVLLNENEKNRLKIQGIDVDEDYFGIDFDFNLDADFSLDTRLSNIVMRFLRKRGNLVYKTKNLIFKFEGRLYKVKTKIFELKKDKDLSESLNSLCEFVGDNKRIVFYAAYINYKYTNEMDRFEESLMVRFAEV